MTCIIKNLARFIIISRANHPARLAEMKSGILIHDETEDGETTVSKGTFGPPILEEDPVQAFISGPASATIVPLSTLA